MEHKPGAARAECPLDGHRQVPVRTCGHTDTDAQTPRASAGLQEQRRTAAGTTAAEGRGRAPRPPSDAESGPQRTDGPERAPCLAPPCPEHSGGPSQHLQPLSPAGAAAVSASSFS